MASAAALDHYSFILNLIEVSGTLPFEVIPGHWLDRATPQQVEMIRNVLFANTFLLAGSVNYGQAQDERGLTYELPADQWRYWVVNFAGPNQCIDHLQWALNLNSPSLELGMTFMGGGMSCRQMALVQYYFEPASWFSAPVPVHTATLHDIRGVYDAVLRVEETHPPIAKSLAHLELLKCLPRATRFAALGHFMVLESLLTHNPHGRADSLIHQVSTKMLLVDKRFRSPLDYSDFDGSPDAIWKKLYAYRSAIAHGGAPDFSNDLRSLRDDRTVIKFMRAAVRSLALLAVLEPVLITDLKAV